MSGSKRWKRTSSIVMSGPSIAWSNVDFSLKEFVQKNTLPQAVKVKKDASKSTAFKSSLELILHDSKTLKKVEACIVSEGKTFIIPYDCPAKVYQLTKAAEYESLGELRKALPTCRFFLVTSKPKDQQLADIEPGEVMTIVFKRNISGSDVFTCERKKQGAGKMEIKCNAKGGFAPMGTTAERKISDFVRQYSTFPVGIGLTESTLTNKAFSALNDVISQSKSGLIRLTRLFTVDTVVGSSLGKRKTVYAIPKALDLTVTASKALLQADSEHTDFCKKLHEDVDQASITTRLSLALSFANAEDEVIQWSYGNDSPYDEVVPLATGKAKNSKVNGEVPKRDGGGVKDQVRKVSGSDLNSKETKEKIKEKDSKEKDKEKPKDKEPKDKIKDKKDKKTKEAKQEKAKVEKSKSNEKQKDEGRKVSTGKEEEDPVEDDAGYLVPAELLRAQRQASEEDNKAGQSKERSSIGIQLGRFMDKVKGKKDGKKSDRPVSNIEIVHETHGEPIKKSATMPANIKKPDLKKEKKAMTMSADQLNKDDTDDMDGPATSTKEKEGKKRDKGLLGTAGRKAGAKLRHKLAKNKAAEDQGDGPKSTSPTSSLPTPPKDKEIDDLDMYVTPVDNQLTNSPSTSIVDRQLPEIPPEELRKPSTVSVPDIPYDDEDLYDEIEPVSKKSFKIPKDLSKLSTNDVSEVLRALNMAEHIPRFRNEQIDGEIFKSLDEKTLGALGVAHPVQRLKVKKLLKGWRPKN